VTWLGKQADELVVLVTCGLSGTSSNYSATHPCRHVTMC
jgi:hypothetical protein